MLRFLNLGKFVGTQIVAIRQPSVLTRDLSATSFLDQANGKNKKGSQAFKGGIGNAGRSKGSKSSGSKKIFGSKMSSPKTTSGTSVCYDKGSNRFTMDLGNNQMARIDYKPIGRNKIELYYTEVPSELRGRGIGKALARGALEQAAKSKMKVKLSCSYLLNNLDKFADDKLKKIVEK